MGYTNYWTAYVANQPTDSEWNAICEAVKKEVFANNNIICLEYDEINKKPIATESEIRFNGKGNEGHETFVLSLDKRGFDFCKTAGKPYDESVVKTLKIAKRICPDWLELSSDGDSVDYKVFD